MDPLVALGRMLRARGYRFTTITPESHARVNGRPGNDAARSLRDVFGWSRSFDASLLPAEMLDLLRKCDAVEACPSGQLRSKVRFSTYRDFIFVHSAFPTTAADSVFFGPDTYRYLDVLRRKGPRAGRAVDVGCGSGAGGIAIASDCAEVVLADINGLALQYARVNVELNDIANAHVVKSDVLRDIEGPFDLVISNPPYLIDEQARLYRDGGGRFGEGLSLEIVRQSLGRLASGGRLILYTASAIIDGVDTFSTAAAPLLDGQLTEYEELDPDVFGDELSRDIYVGVDRIAVVALDVRIR